MQDKILYFVTHRIDLRGGQERSMHEVLTRLSQKGWQITIISFTLEDWPENLKIKWIKVPGKSIPTQLFKNTWFSLLAYLILLLKKRRLTLTIGTSSWFADVRIVQFVHHAYFSLIKKDLAPYPNAKSFFHRFYQMIFLKQCIALERLLFPKSKKLIAISKTVKSSLLTYKKREEITIIHHAPDLIDQDLNKKDNNLVKILFVGALERKGIEKALRCLSLIKSINWSFDVVGAGSIEKWKKYCQQLGLSEKITFHGVKKSIPYFKDADIFFFPSTYEPYGLVVSEAVSYSCSLLVSSECGAMELWDDRPDWLKLSALDNDQHWADSLDKLIKSSECRDKYARQASLSFNTYDWQKAAEMYDSELVKIK